MKFICPICHEKLKCSGPDDPEAGKYFPFCSERCRMVDLGAWLDSEYAFETDESEDEQITPPDC